MFCDTASAVTVLAAMASHRRDRPSRHIATNQVTNGPEPFRIERACAAIIEDFGLEFAADGVSARFP